MRLVHLTDPHLSSLQSESFSKLRGKRWSGYLSWKKNRRKRYLPSVLNSLTEAVKAEAADQILLTGDLIQIGLETEIAQATQWLTELGPAEKVMLVPGNHDIYAQGSADIVYQAWSEYLFQGDPSGSAGNVARFPVERRLGKLSLIGVSTACVTPVFMASGRLGNKQLNELSEMLDQASDEGQLVCLLIHHPPLPGMTHWRKALSDAAALKTILERHPPALTFHGHLHHNRQYQWDESHIYCTAAASSAADASYRVIDIEDKGDFWGVRMMLKSIDIEPADKPGFVTIDDQFWQISKK